jgi:hypothetical protein
MTIPRTPDGRYSVYMGHLWRCPNPALSEEERARLAQQLVTLRRALALPRGAGEQTASSVALGKEVERVKIALGQHGPVWWTDGAPDYHRTQIENSPYADWWSNLRHTSGRSTTRQA